MRQLSCIDLATLRNTSDWVAQVGVRFDALKLKTLFVDIASQLGKNDCNMRARMHRIVLPSTIAQKRGVLPGFPHMSYRWQNANSECCGGLELSGACTKRKLLALLRDMQERGFVPGTSDLMIFLHEPNKTKA